MSDERKRPPRLPCAGSAIVIPVPAGMTPEESWAETTTLGRLARKPTEKGLTWATIECPGDDDCRCRFVDRSDCLWRHWHNDVLVEAELFGHRVPHRLLPLLNAVVSRGRP